MIINQLIKEIDKIDNQNILIEGFPESQEIIQLWKERSRGIAHTKSYFFFDQFQPQKKSKYMLATEEPQEINQKEINQYFKSLDKFIQIDTKKNFSIIERQVDQLIQYYIHKKAIILPQIILTTNLTENSNVYDILKKELKPLFFDVQKIEHKTDQELVNKLGEIILYTNDIIVIKEFPSNFQQFVHFYKLYKDKIQLKLCIYGKGKVLEKQRTQTEIETELVEKSTNNNQKEIWQTYQSISVHSDKIQQAIFDKFTSQKYPQIIFLIGGYGAGKSTQAHNINTKFNIPFIQISKILFDNLTDNEQRKKFEKNDLVDSSFVIDLLREQIIKHRAAPVILIDGFPKTFDNLDMWYKKMIGMFSKEHFIYFEAERKNLKARLVKNCVGDLDENIQRINKKLDQFFNQTQYLIQYLKNYNKIISIQAARSNQTVFNELSKIVQNVLDEKF